MQHQGLDIRFWGTRGNMAPFASSRKFGIQTTAVEIAATGAALPLFVDFGSGIVPAAAAALAAGTRRFHILLTHLHIDHLHGLFSFAPFYRADCAVHIEAARADLETGIKALLAPPYHPIPFAKLAAAITFGHLSVHGSRTDPEHGLAIRWGQLAHPQGCTGYRFDDGVNALVFATDVELGETAAQAPLRELLCHPYPAGLAVIDGFFPDAEIDQYATWGHSSWRQAEALTRDCGVANLVVTHHHPGRTDAQLQAVEAQARPVRWAREGETLRLENNRLIEKV